MMRRLSLLQTKPVQEVFVKLTAETFRCGYCLRAGVGSGILRGDFADKRRAEDVVVEAVCPLSALCG
jgi:hypothetical protein